MSTNFIFGRLGLASSRIPHADRHGLIWLERGKLSVEDGTLRFAAAQSNALSAGVYSIPYQGISMILLAPGTSITHDVFRLAASHGVSIVAVGDGGVKCYTAPPIGQGLSDVARTHASVWANKDKRVYIARKMYAWRFGCVLPHRDISTLRGIEGARLKESYRLIAQKFGVNWQGRLFDRSNPSAADIPNQAINHAATFVESAAEIAVTAVGAIPQLGFIHEQSSNAFTLDIADLYRVDVTLPLAFGAAKKAQENPAISLEKTIRYSAAKTFQENKLISCMIDRIKDILNADDSDLNT